MKAETKEKWVAALRSGEYQQCAGVLQDISGANCCLGVLCRVMGAQIDEYRTFHWKDSRGYACLPRALEQEIGLSDRVMSELTRMNDNGGKSFNDIASYIARYVKPS
jgi:hypothetical protein